MALQAGSRAKAPVELAARLAARFAETAEQHDREASFPFENFRQLHAAGLLGLTVPARLGGAGAHLQSATEVVRAIAKGEASTALVLAMQYAQHASIQSSRRFPPHLADRLGREAVSRGALVNALRVEPELGTPARGGLPATMAVRTKAGWRLDGRKIYATGAPVLSWYLVWARTDEAATRVGQFLVEAGTSGLRIEPTWDHLGMRASGSHDVVLEDVAVPADHAVDVRQPSEWAQEERPMAWNTLLIAALYDGIARTARNWLCGFLQTRVPSALGASLATLPRMQSAVGEIEGRLAVNARLIAAAARDVDAGICPSLAELGLIKRAVCEQAIAAVEASLKLTGNHGLSRANPLERHYRDVLCARVHTPQEDSALLAAGKAALDVAEPMRV